MTFVENVLMPLLNFESKAAVILNIWDSSTGLYISDLSQIAGRQVGNSIPQQEVKNLKTDGNSFN